MFSEIYAPEFIPKVIIAVTVSGKPLIANTANAIINSCNAIGVPLITITYTSHKNAANFIFLLRVAEILISETITPNTKPIASAENAIIKVIFNPSANDSIYFLVLKSSSNL